MFYYNHLKHLSPLSILFPIQSQALNLLNTARASALTVCLFYGVRVNEVLSLTVREVLTGSRVYIKPSKGSGTRILYLPTLSEQLEDFSPLTPETRLFPFTYSQIYRLSLKLGIGERLKYHKNNTVTHLGRFFLADEISLSCVNLEQLNIFNHTKKTNINFYLNKRSNKNG